VFAVPTFVPLNAKTKQVEKLGVVAVLDTEWCPQRFKKAVRATLAVISGTA